MTIPYPPTAHEHRTNREFAPKLLLRAQPVELAIFDVDGVMTDGGIYFAETPDDGARIADETIKRFNTLDGLGLQLLKRAGITPAVISGRNSKPLQQRLARLGISHCYLGHDKKLEAAQQLLAQLGLQWSQVATMGDDWPDLPLMCKSAVAVAPPGAHWEVLQRAHYTTTASAGHGAVRELCDMLVCAKGRYQSLLGEWMDGA